MSLGNQIATLYARLGPIRLIETLPGVGALVGAGICAVLGGPAHGAERFPGASHLVSYVGLDPRKNQSGGNDRQGSR